MEHERSGTARADTACLGHGSVLELLAVFDSNGRVGDLLERGLAERHVKHRLARLARHDDALLRRHATGIARADRDRCRGWRRVRGRAGLGRHGAARVVRCRLLPHFVALWVTDDEEALAELAPVAAGMALVKVDEAVGRTDVAVGTGYDGAHAWRVTAVGAAAIARSDGGSRNAEA